jgi:hypothetical protein
MGEAKRKKDAGVYFGQPGHVPPEQTMPGPSRPPAELHGEPPRNDRETLSTASVLALLAVHHLSGMRRRVNSHQPSPLTPVNKVW